MAGIRGDVMKLAGQEANAPVHSTGAMGQFFQDSNKQNADDMSKMAMNMQQQITMQPQLAQLLQSSQGAQAQGLKTDLIQRALLNQAVASQAAGGTGGSVIPGLKL
jgi:hypothetical protein